MKWLVSALFVTFACATAVAGDLPDGKKTPGDVDPTLTKEILCAKDFSTASIRDVPPALRRKVFQSYGINCTISGRPITRIAPFSEHVTLLVSNFLASDAQPRSLFTDSSIFRREGMSTGADRSRGLFCQRSSASKDINAVGHSLQMLWIDASWIPTEMVQFEAERDFSVAQFVREDMRSEDFPLIENAPISTGLESRACPVPAASLAVNGDFRPERLIYRFAAANHEKQSTSKLPACNEFEIDHLISLELGGTNEITNLWPQSYLTTPWNAHLKDKLENRLHKLVCNGVITLDTAQKEIREDWTKAYEKYIGD